MGVWNAVEGIQQLGPGTLLAKIDIQSVCFWENCWRFIALFRRTNDVELQQRVCGPKRMLRDLEQLTLLHLLLENHSTCIYFYGNQTKLENLLGARASTVTICRTLQSIGCTCQVRWHVAIQHSDTLRAHFMADISIYNPRMFVWIWGTLCTNMDTACVASQFVTIAC